MKRACISTFVLRVDR